jgi:UDP-glucose 4-epimerase
MLKHLNKIPVKPSRVVILGSGGFVGGATLKRLKKEGVSVLALARTDLDLLSTGAGDKLATLLKADDALVVISAKAPVKNNAMLLDNIAMMKSVCDALEKQTVAHVVYFSSDAVYADSPDALDETSSAQPASLHGVMHLAREVMLANTCTMPLAVLRPTLIYGLADPHNGYGPNRFRRLAAEGQEIVLFGNGEERRDHVLVDDVAELCVQTLLHKSEGVLNVTSGAVTSFKEIAEKVVALFEKPVAIKGSPRVGEMPHNGYRPFDPKATCAAFPDFKYTSIDAGLEKTHRDMMEQG